MVFVQAELAALGGGAAAAAAAPVLIALMNHTQSDADLRRERVELLDSLGGFLDEEMDEDVALDVLDVPAQ